MVEYLVESLLSSVAWFAAGALTMWMYGWEHDRLKHHPHHRKGPR